MNRKSIEPVSQRSSSWRIGFLVLPLQYFLDTRTTVHTYLSSSSKDHHQSVGPSEPMSNFA